MDEKKAGSQSSFLGYALLSISFLASELWYFSSFWNVGLLGNIQQGTALLSQIYNCSIVAFVFTMALAIVFQRVRDRLVFCRYGVPLLVFAMVVSTCLVFIPSVLLSIDATTAIPFVLVGTLLMGSSSALWMLRLGTTIVSRGVMPTLMVVLIGEVGAILLYNPLLSFPGPLFVLTTALMPIFSAFSLVKVEDSSSAPKNSDETDSPKERDGKRERPRQLVRFSICAFIVGVINEANGLLFDKSGLHGYPIGQNDFIFSQGIIAIITVLFCGAVSYLLLKDPSKSRSGAIFGVIFAMLLIGTVALPVSCIFSSVTELGLFLGAFSSASYECFFLMVWIVPAAISSLGMCAAVEALAISRFSWAFGQMLGIIIAGLADSVSGIGFVSVYTVCAVVAILLSFLKVFPGDEFKYLLDRQPQPFRVFSGALLSENAKEHDAEPGECSGGLPGVPTYSQISKESKVLEQISSSYGLTARETEVMGLLSSGCTPSYIQETLFLSKSTVSTHRQHIYQKLGIHSQQELMAIVYSALRDAE